MLGANWYVKQDRLRPLQCDSLFLITQVDFKRMWAGGHYSLFIIHYYIAAYHATNLTITSCLANLNGTEISPRVEAEEVRHGQKGSNLKIT